MINKKFDSITIDDIIQLKDNAVQEGKTIEYKQILPSGNDSDKKEFLADTTSFSNTVGGDIIYGIKEDNGIPKGIIGVEVADIDSEVRRLDSIIRDGVEPRIITHIKSIPISGSKVVLLIRVQQSWNKPHRVIFKGHDRFYARNSAGKYPLDTFELKNAFTESNMVEEKIRNFRSERVYSLMSEEAPIPFMKGAKSALHLIPIDAFNKRTDYDVKSEEIFQFLHPLRGSGFDNRLNFDGIITYAGDRSQSHSYVQLYRNGIIESVNGSLYQENNKQSYIPNVAFEQSLLRGLGNYLKLLKMLDVTLPVFCLLSLIDVKGFTLGVSNIDAEEIFPIDRDVLTLPEVVIENYSEMPEKILKPVFDLVWNACGLPRSRNFDENGSWKPR